MRKGQYITDTDLKLETFRKGNKSYWVEILNIFGFVTYSGMCKAAIVGYDQKQNPVIFCRLLKRNEAITVTGKADLSFYFKHKLGKLRFYRAKLAPELIGFE